MASPPPIVVGARDRLCALTVDVLLQRRDERARGEGRGSLGQVCDLHHRLLQRPLRARLGDFDGLAQVGDEGAAQPGHAHLRVVLRSLLLSRLALRAIGLDLFTVAVLILQLPGQEQPRAALFDDRDNVPGLPELDGAQVHSAVGSRFCVAVVALDRNKLTALLRGDGQVGLRAHGDEQVAHGIHEDRAHEAGVGDEREGGRALRGDPAEEFAVDVVAEAEGADRAWKLLVLLLVSLQSRHDALTVARLAVGQQHDMAQVALFGVAERL
mmetsp:Transcript_99/g.255  ORF Transcript_99/g.255 Transcript_99/m.255 type:complete len:269 (-) Transcript_99:524-1330(-)